MIRLSILIAVVAATTAITASAPQACADSPEPSPTSSAPPPVLRLLPPDPPRQWPVQQIDGSPQRMVFITAATDGASMDIDGTQFILASDVLFAYNKATLTSRARALLNDVIDKISASPPQGLKVAGHTDSDGTAAANRKLSLRRAAAVRRYLVAHLVTEVPITTVGHGETKPRFTNKTKAGRAANRRVEITVTP